MPEKDESPPPADILPWEFYTLIALVVVARAAVIWRYWPRASRADS